MLLPYISIINADLCVAQVSRLILNLLKANCPLDESIDSGTVETLMFYLQSPLGTLRQIFREMIKELPPWAKEYMKRQDDG